MNGGNAGDQPPLQTDLNSNKSVDKTAIATPMDLQVNQHNINSIKSQQQESTGKYLCYIIIILN
jgi:hypothetical protein